MPSENKKPNIISPVKTEKIPFEDFRDEMIDQYDRLKDSKWDWRITNDQLSSKDREKGVKDIRAGKDSAPARKIEAHIQEMYDNGVVPMNRGRGNNSLLSSEIFRWQELRGSSTRQMVGGGGGGSKVMIHHDWITE